MLKAKEKKLVEQKRLLEEGGGDEMSVEGSQAREKMAEGESKVFSGHGSLQISMAKEQE